ncbi:MAG TPA: hypothetical protein VI072_06890, partial [Polyangiaceae bacterium]
GQGVKFRVVVAQFLTRILMPFAAGAVFSWIRDMERRVGPRSIQSSGAGLSSRWTKVSVLAAKQRPGEARSIRSRFDF